MLTVEQLAQVIFRASGTVGEVTHLEIHDPVSVISTITHAKHATIYASVRWREVGIV